MRWNVLGHQGLAQQSVGQRDGDRSHSTRGLGTMQGIHESMSSGGSESILSYKNGFVSPLTFPSVMDLGKGKNKPTVAAARPVTFTAKIIDISISNHIYYRYPEMLFVHHYFKITVVLGPATHCLH